MKVLEYFNSNQVNNHYCRRDINAQMHRLAATITASHENQTGTNIGPICTAHWLKALTACRTATMPKMMPETSVYLFFIASLPVNNWFSIDDGGIKFNSPGTFLYHGIC